MRLEELDSDEVPEIPMGPLIDCVFLLLIFFLVVAVTQKTVRDLNITLPTFAATDEIKPRDRDVVIRVTADGTVYLGSDPMTAQTLKNALREQARIRTEETQVRLEADIGVPMRTLAPIIEELEFSGFPGFVLRSSDPGAPAGGGG